MQKSPPKNYPPHLYSARSFINSPIHELYPKPKCVYEYNENQNHLGIHPHWNFKIKNSINRVNRPMYSVLRIRCFSVPINFIEFTLLKLEKKIFFDARKIISNRLMLTVIYSLKWVSFALFRIEFHLRLPYACKIRWLYSNI